MRLAALLLAIPIAYSIPAAAQAPVINGVVSQATLAAPVSPGMPVLEWYESGGRYGRVSRSKSPPNLRFRLCNCEQSRGAGSQCLPNSGDHLYPGGPGRRIGERGSEEPPGCEFGSVHGNSGPVCTRDSENG